LKRATRLICATAAAALALVLVTGATATAKTKKYDPRIIYTSIPQQLPGNVVSKGFECCGVIEFGDGVVFAQGAGGSIDQITVVMSSWACQQGNWTSNCVTKHEAKFEQTITLNVHTITYQSNVPTQGSLLLTKTQTFKIPYRPSSDPANCGGDNQMWYDEKDNTCYHGLAVPIKFDLDSKVSLPDRAIISVTFNTSTQGLAPLGTGTACYSTLQGCPYDSLNVGTDGPGGLVGSVIDPNGVFDNLRGGDYCQPHSSPGYLELDTPCWTGLHPLIEVVSNGRMKARGKHEDLSD
jgi:hypothetical protein